MKILFISDIHGITENLGVIEKLEQKEKFDKIICLGDLYYAGPTFDKSKEVSSHCVLDFLMKYNSKMIAVRGNCDSDVDVKATDFPILNNLGLIMVDGNDLYFTHGNEYSIEKNRKFNRKGVLIYGHEHEPFIEKRGDMVYINVGSISVSKSDVGCTYGIYENNDFTIYNINHKIINNIKFKKKE
ncbi:MAG TPA: phosphodiesterase [Candidatus Faecisoma merdavium]|nr:phosphodiesterase [Candidatus Faecisoma merdavium]